MIHQQSRIDQKWIVDIVGDSDAALVEDVALTCRIECSVSGCENHNIDPVELLSCAFIPIDGSDRAFMVFTHGKVVAISTANESWKRFVFYSLAPR